MDHRRRSRNFNSHCWSNRLFVASLFELPRTPTPSNKERA